ncbi:MAG: glycosyltransferase [Desulfovibrionaceae bacterium]|nr:glycosyltransferase [Desulfovibrionaceae bacterium]MDD4951862.1 glycosyltransferase [Desulfovibrionaceae bacterium]
MANSLRILVVLPLYGGSLPIGRYCSRALSQAGHLVEVFEGPDFYPSYQGLDSLRVTSDRLEFLQNSYLQVVSQAVLAKVETFEPDLVLALAQAPLTRQALKRLRRDKVATAMWFVEDCRLFTYWQAFAPLYDVFAVIQKGSFFENLNEIGQKNVLYLPLAAQPDVHRPLDLTPAEARRFGSDLSFMGAGYPNRRLAFRELTGFGLRIWGTEWEGDHVLWPLVQMAGARVSTEDCVRIFNATKVNLNLHSSVDPKQAVGSGDFVNPRTFELAACGAFQLVDRRELLAEAFDQDELATFGSIEELKDKIAYFLAHPDEREAFAHRARARALREHTYQARMDRLLEFVSERLANWPRPRDAGELFAPDFPEDLRREIQGLVARLGLPADVSFKDLVWAVRRQQGELSDLDTALLFLDEWRKLYGKRPD